jgi:acyl-CoA synthetase (AMP-forming)/AMP-acid ligase II
VVDRNELRAGAQLVPINHLNKASEIRYIVEAAGASILLTDAAVFDRNIKDSSAVPGVSPLPPAAFSPLAIT